MYSQANAQTWPAHAVRFDMEREGGQQNYLVLKAKIKALIRTEN